MLHDLEIIARDYEKLIAALSAISTALTALFALWSIKLVQRSKNFDFGVVADLADVRPTQAGQAKPIVGHSSQHVSIVATVTNFGIPDVHVMWVAFELRIPFAKRGALVEPITDFRARHTLAVCNGQSISIELMTPQVLEELISKVGIRWLPRIRLKNSYLLFRLPTGETRKVAMEAALVAFLKTNATRSPLLY